ncbi:hypothetical protein BCV69DRAFT_8890 [Microstroma glucosiphilum]|uniref:Uncharacterized protein n=1 Tax=Pseudomicrostroma glucosiphilum TaxID=1684307 RepID=A0A316UET4_9BASI|nr:hypothetical protein BCV69DRAFT_8890 [Pseudomicrostroma glucosiphilum]PWN23749.1 hypothetical protein BCV69DRAFT_8890 [Pseudomicrostroma glucosiphilum]
MSVLHPPQKKGSFSVTGIVLTTISVAAVLTAAIALYVRYRRIQRASSAQSPRSSQQPRESRFKSLWILAARHRKGNPAVFSETKQRPTEGSRAHSRGQSYATTSSKGDDIELDISDVQWTQSPHWIQPPTLERQQTALSISVEHLGQVDARVGADATPAQYQSMSRSPNLSLSRAEPTSHLAPSSYPQRPPLVNNHSTAGSTLSIPRIVIGGSPMPSPTHSAFPANGLRRPGTLSRHGSEAPSLADSVPRTVTPTEEIDEDMMLTGSA